MGFSNFMNDLDPPRLHYTMEIQGNLGLELRSKGIQGVPQFHKRIGSPETSLYYGIEGNLGLELRSKGLPHRKWISYNLWRSRGI